MAGRTDEPLERLAKIPTYVIHSRDDEVVPFAQAEQRAAELTAHGPGVKFDALQGVGHYAMRGYVGALNGLGGGSPNAGRNRSMQLSRKEFLGLVARGAVAAGATTLPSSRLRADSPGPIMTALSDYMAAAAERALPRESSRRPSSTF